MTGRNKAEKKEAPVATESFEELISRNLYYVDKTLLVVDIIKQVSVGLFLRPRRIGRTLTLSMLQCFFEDSGNEERNKARRALS